MENPLDKTDTEIYCDLCCLQPDGSRRWPTTGKPALAVADGPTRTGKWAYMCQRHLGSAGFKFSTMNHQIKRP